MVSGGGQVGLKGWGWCAVEERSAGDSSKRAEGGRRNEGKSRNNAKIFCNLKWLKRES